MEKLFLIPLGIGIIFILRGALDRVTSLKPRAKYLGERTARMLAAERAEGYGVTIPLHDRLIWLGIGAGFIVLSLILR